MAVTTTRISFALFVPFVVVALAHLIGLGVGNLALSGLTKPLLMPGLVFALLSTVRPRATTIVITTCIALAFSWLGDLLLAIPGGLGFLLGLGGFFLAHVAYLTLFARSLRIRRVPPVALFFAGWWVALLVVLAPYLGALLVPVAVYGLALGASAALALGCNRFVAIGASTFLVSDTILAFKFFYPDFGIWQQDLLIMFLYCAGQGLIVFGVTRASEPARSELEPAVSVA
jgi:alkenylglycerophosphocholine/alkenylglycerophosphoethanolamine hydrolase